MVSVAQGRLPCGTRPSQIAAWVGTAATGAGPADLATALVGRSAARVKESERALEIEELESGL